MHPIGRDVSSHPKHPGRFVPHIHRTKIENVKFKKLKDNNSKKEILNHNDIQQLKKLYSFNLNPNKPVKLGNTGISIVFMNGKYHLIK